MTMLSERSQKRPELDACGAEMLAAAMGLTAAAKAARLRFDSGDAAIVTKLIRSSFDLRTVWYCSDDGVTPARDMPPSISIRTFPETPTLSWE
ncbi:hypothetical protein N8D56_27565 (plasmid) [Devosia sp. A8/3-2]|nr:hypothetical protein N8D56_27565 [Devosia sp. A8/3-2]